eukprot:CAMPEP_0117545804 /NCGR_PEP_ID=MMETSP0784-20121206/46285_1 /TAXON_ID=39447 /ORGANISM="" /LENGTH=364 /DNA_ID=CAMNT_0005342665 /DNA_START=59 /DNA_END=1153 /DNA_ORIENTATION=-
MGVEHATDPSQLHCAADGPPSKDQAPLADTDCKNVVSPPRANAVVADEEAGLDLTPKTLAGLEVEIVNVCGLDLRILRRRADFFAACAGDLPIMSTGLVLWECANLLADYLGYARFLAASGGDDAAPAPWWLTHPPAPVVPCRFWTGKRVLELGGGCGLVAVTLACLGADVVCTDGDLSAVATAKRNALEAQRRYQKDWGKLELLHLPWGDAEAAKRMVRAHGPFDYVVGSDLLYGDKAPPEPLVETLATLMSEPGCQKAEVVIALKNRCADEVSAFRRAVEARKIWDVSMADPGDFLDGYEGRSDFYGSDGPMYGIVLLRRPTRPDEAGDAPTARPLAIDTQVCAEEQHLPKRPRTVADVVGA